MLRCDAATVCAVANQTQLAPARQIRCRRQILPINNNTTSTTTTSPTTPLGP